MSIHTAKPLEKLFVAAQDTSRVRGLTHTYYKYPARLSPTFVRAAIEAFTQPGDWVLDPFVGGGTSLVEARALGRFGVGVDNNELAVFVSKVKTTSLTEDELNRAYKIAQDLAEDAKLTNQPARPWSWIDDGYLKNLDLPSVWRIRKQLEIILEEVSGVRNSRLQMFLRCALLRTAQWALDNRRITPSVAEFRKKFLESVSDMTDGMQELLLKERNSMQEFKLLKPLETHVVHTQSQVLDTNLTIAQLPPPKLVITSPPYPGVHVLYHRWQIHGRRETSAPYWIANCHDGHGGTHYTFGHRNEIGLKKYYSMLESTFRSITTVLDKKSVVIQVVAFSEPSWQLPRYLEVMESVGLKESSLPPVSGAEDGRLWREVPSRKWYAAQRGKISSGRELILVHTAK